MTALNSVSKNCRDHQNGIKNQFKNNRIRIRLLFPTTSDAMERNDIQARHSNDKCSDMHDNTWPQVNVGIRDHVCIIKSLILHHVSMELVSVYSIQVSSSTISSTQLNECKQYLTYSSSFSSVMSLNTTLPHHRTFFRCC